MRQFALVVCMFWMLLPDVSNAQGYEVVELDFNSPASDYSPVPYKEGIIFCSNRRHDVVSTHVDRSKELSTNLWFVELSDKAKQPKLFAPSLKSIFNEGPMSLSSSGKELYFTANLDPEVTNNSKKADAPLGIFKCVWTSDGWSDPESFQYNSPDGTFHCAHPALSPDGQYLYFSSDRPGGHGESDIYVCSKTEEGWGKPENLGSKINTAGKESFPFVRRNGWLYFSSDGRTEEKGLDIFFSYQKDNGEWDTPVNLGDPVNSSFDDFACSVSPDGESGYFSSNRSGKSDDIYKYHYRYPEFQGCQESMDPAFCYLIEETEITPVDTLPLVYEWDFGDGTTERGLSNEHCFPDYGTYDVVLNIYDTLTGMHYAQVSAIQVMIERPRTPHISAPDTVKANESFALSAANSQLKDFPLDEYYWDLGEGTKYRGTTATHVYSQPGNYQIVLGALSLPQDGQYWKTCSYKNIVVVDENATILAQNDPFEVSDEVLSAEVFEDIDGDGYSDRDSSVYFVDFYESEEPVSFSDPYFEKVSYPITERYESEDSLFHYSVGQETELSSLYKIYNELVDSGYIETIVMEREFKEYSTDILKRGMYYPEEVKNEMKREVSKLADIQFAYNSDQLNSASFDNLDNIVAILMLEPEIGLTISAHTDNKGRDKYNLDLSNRRAKVVVEYLVKKGIDINRLDWAGYGNTRPIDTNSTEAGRARNRRVEFELQFEEYMGANK